VFGDLGHDLAFGITRGDEIAIQADFAAFHNF
jgi:hypothetical protein